MGTSTSKWPRRILVALFVLAVTAGLWIPLLVFAVTATTEKDYSFPEVTIDATIEPNGDLVIEERRTFAFRNGPFTFAYFNVEDPDRHVQDFSISEVRDGREIPLNAVGGFSYASNGFEARWDYPPAEDEERTFVIRYRDICAVDRYPDGAHLYWQFIGTGWEKETDHAVVTIHVPPHAGPRAVAEGPAATAAPRRGEPQAAAERCVIDPFDRAALGLPAGSDGPSSPVPDASGRGGEPLETGDVRAWAHGPLNGTVTLPDAQTVVLDVRDVPAGDFVEGSMVFPNDSVPLAPEAPEAAIDRIVAREQRWAAEANDLRREHAAQMQVFWVLLFGVPPVMILLIVISRVRDRVPTVPETLEEPPEGDPVEAAFLWRQYAGGSPANAYRAQLLALVRIGAVEIRAEGLVSDPDDLTLVRRANAHDLNAAERDFMEMLFGRETDTDAVDEVSIKRPKPRAGSGPARYQSWLRAAKQDVARAIVTIEKSDTRFESVTQGVLGVVTAGFGLWSWLFGQGGDVVLWLLPWGLAWMMIALRLTYARLQPDLRERMARLAAFRRFLAKFSSLPDAPAMAVIIWERYLEWAVALDVADEVERQVKALIPTERLQAVPGTQLTGAQAFVMFTSLNSVANTLVVTSSASPSSGSTGGGFGSSSPFGGGGGFSGGGGGGGGGTGGGAG